MSPERYMVCSINNSNPLTSSVNEISAYMSQIIFSFHHFVGVNCNYLVCVAFFVCVSLVEPVESKQRPWLGPSIFYGNPPPARQLHGFTTTTQLYVFGGQSETGILVFPAESYFHELNMDESRRSA